MLERIQVRKAIPIGHENEKVVGSPSHADSAWVLQNRVDGCFAARDRRNGGNVWVQPQRNFSGHHLPWPFRPCGGRGGRPAVTGLAQERNLASVRRPRRLRIAPGRRRNEADRLVRQIKADKTMVSPVRDKRQLLPVRRPRRRVARTARIKELLRLLRSIDWRNPDLPVSDESDAIRIRRYSRIVTFTDQFW